MARHLLVPGRGVPLAGHWMRAWACKPGYAWAALLVTPPFIPPEWMDVPRRALPFRSVLVASRTDPHCTMAQALAYADDWGSEVVDAGDVGHLDSATGFGSWPDGEALVGRLDGT
jgi:predicted alpha/beta hydrolase family esterase